MIYHEKAPGVEDSLADKLDVYSRPGAVRAREVNHRPVRSKEEADSQHLALFDKVKNFKTAEQLKQAELYPYFRTISSAQDTEVDIGGKKVLMLGSNS